MNEEVKKKLEAAIVACADKAAKAVLPIDAMQFTQAACNATNALVSFIIQDKK